MNRAVTFRCVRCRKCMLAKPAWINRLVRCTGCQFVMRLVPRAFIERMTYRSRN